MNKNKIPVVTHFSFFDGHDISTYIINSVREYKYRKVDEKKQEINEKVCVCVCVCVCKCMCGVGG